MSFEKDNRLKYKAKSFACAAVLFLFCHSAAFSSSIEKYWNEHTVNSRLFKTPEESIWYLSWRNEQYPQFKELMYPEKSALADKVIIDYGCGPGNDLVYFLVNTSAKKIIGMDVSQKALDLAQERVRLHKEQGHDINRVEFLKVSDDSIKIPLADQSVDYINCCGVLMHVSGMNGVLNEFNRILKPGGKIRLMLYNGNSLWKHLYVGYQKMALGQPMGEVAVSDEYHKEKPAIMSLDEAFKRSTDGVECPKSDNYTPEDFVKRTSALGFQSKYLGAYFSTLELDLFNYYKLKLKNLPHSSEINDASINFIKSIIVGNDGYPKYKGENADIGAVYELSKPS